VRRGKEYDWIALYGHAGDLMTKMGDKAFHSRIPAFLSKRRAERGDMRVNIGFTIDELDRIRDLPGSDSVPVAIPKGTDRLAYKENWLPSPVNYTAGSVSSDFWDDYPDLLTAAELAQRLNITAISVEASARDGKLLSVGGENIPVRYPACQVTDGAILPGLDQVLAVADGRRWAIYELLSRPQPEFNGATGVEMLRRGKIEIVIAHLTGYGDGFA
jgi:hypothetical protein